MAAATVALTGLGKAWSFSRNCCGLCKSRSSNVWGSTRTIQINVRLIAATHRDLRAMIRDEKFREDLFYCFNVFPIEIPPLRERREDIPLLGSYFVSKLSRRMRERHR